MTVQASLKEALLDLGLEDLIALPEIALTPEVRAEFAPALVAVIDISTALIELLREGRIQVWAAHWPEEPSVLTDSAAESVLRDHRRYSFTSEPVGAKRAYYVNVDNLRA